MPDTFQPSSIFPAKITPNTSATRHTLHTAEMRAITGSLVSLRICRRSRLSRQMDTDSGTQ